MPALFLRFCILLSFVLFVRAGAKNITIDDEKGDQVTGAQPVYQPRTEWSLGSACQGCWAKPNPAKVTDGTWHDTTAFNSTPTNVTVQFTGTAVYVFCVIPNLVNGTIPTNTNIGFSLDGNNDYPRFNHSSDGTTNMVYNTMVFSKQGLANQPHTLVVSSIAVSDAKPALMLFDYVMYTSEQNSTVTSSNSGATSSQAPSSISGSSSSTAPGDGSSASNSYSTPSSSQSTGQAAPTSASRPSRSVTASVAGTVIGSLILSILHPW